jgi:hypothetical protein
VITATPIAQLLLRLDTSVTLLRINSSVTLLRFEDCFYYYCTSNCLYCAAALPVITTDVAVIRGRLENRAGRGTCSASRAATPHLQSVRESTEEKEREGGESVYPRVRAKSFQGTFSSLMLSYIVARRSRFRSCLDHFFISLLLCSASHFPQIRSKQAGSQPRSWGCVASHKAHALCAVARPGRRGAQ